MLESEYQCLEQSLKDPPHRGGQAGQKSCTERAPSYIAGYRELSKYNENKGSVPIDGHIFGLTGLAHRQRNSSVHSIFSKISYLHLHQ